MTKPMLKDAAMDEVATQGGNVACFASFAPDGTPRFARIRGLAPSRLPISPGKAIDALLRMGIRTVNVRTFTPDQPDGNPFHYGLDAGRAVAVSEEMMAAGYHVIINETVDVNDGGFSGVMYGDVCEFASRDTPRCVEKPDTASLSRDATLALVRTVYGFNLHLPYPSDYRVEFSVHPGPVGYLGQRWLVWQAEEIPGGALRRAEPPLWPNRYSRDLGDKAYGILMADNYGFPVPRTAVFGRVVPYFTFGREVSAGVDNWIRTCPRTQQPGLFTTKRGWADPFEIMQREDPNGTEIAAILVQNGVAAKWSGAALTTATGEPLIEGQAGEGDNFMVGEAGVVELPEEVYSQVRDLWWRLKGTFGPVRFEWAYDGQMVWVLQLHAGASASFGTTIYEGDPNTWVDFEVEQGLEALRALVAEAKEAGFGIKLRGNVGVTSHFGDLLRRGQVPSRIVRP